MLQDRLEVSIEGQKIYENPKASLFEVYKDLWTSNEIRQNSHQYGLANSNTRKLFPNQMMVLAREMAKKFPTY